MASGSVAPLIVIAGPTASGKTSLAIDLAERYGGEIICADSRTIYRGMDIGTAKPTIEERRGVPHWGLDLVEPGEAFSAAQFKSYAQQKIAEIRQRGRVPFLVGGTGLYIDAVIFDFQFGRRADEGLREMLTGMSIKELQKYCEKNNIKLPENDKNKRYLIRAIERGGRMPVDSQQIGNCYVVGITTYKKVLRKRIEQRAAQMMSAGVVKETSELAGRYGWQSEAMTGNIYPLVERYMRGEIDEAQLQQQFIISDWRLSRRQMAWLRRNPWMIWSDLQHAEHYLSGILANW